MIWPFCAEFVLHCHSVNTLGSLLQRFETWCKCLQSVVSLTTQYRMAEDIQLIANTLIYNGRLQCGSSQVGGATLFAQIPPHLLGCYPSWLLQVSTAVPTLMTINRSTLILIDRC